MKGTTRVALLLTRSVVLLCAAAAFAGSAPANVPLSFEEVLNAPSLAAYSPPAFSADQKMLAYVVTDPTRKRVAFDDTELLGSGVAWYGVASDIHVTDIETGKHTNVTGGMGHSWAPAWSPAGRQLAFLSDRTPGPKLGPARLWIWDQKSGALRQAGNADVREGFSGLQWTGDGRSILVSLFPADRSREQYAQSIGGKKPAKTATAPSDVTAQVFEFDPAAKDAVPSTDQINLDIFRRELGMIDVVTGELRTVVKGLRVGHAVLSPDGTKLAVAVLRRAEKPGAGQYLYDLVSYDLKANGERVVASDVPLSLLAGSFSWSPDGRSIAYRTGGPTATDEVRIVAVAGGTPRSLWKATTAGALQFEIDPPVWDASGRNVFFLEDDALMKAAADGSGATAVASFPGVEVEIIAPRQHRLFMPEGDRAAVVMTLNSSTKRAGFARVDLSTGAVRDVTQEDRRYGGYGTEPTISPDGRSLAFVAEDALHAPDVYVASGEGMVARRISQVAPALTDRPFGRAEVLEWRSLDGVVQRGALVYPSTHEAGKRYPLIVKVYGGSTISNDLNRFGQASAAYENLQIFATRGYAILIADSKVNVGTPMVDLMKSVMPGINAAIEKGVADPDRIGVTGHSYGGYSTLSLIAQSPRFKAAVMRAGMGNLMSGYGQLSPDGTNYGVSWSEGGQGRMGGHPWELREHYLENSPIFYLHRVQTPLLIIHGSEDTAVPVFLADEVFTALRRLGKPVTYVRYEGEDHWEGSWNYANQLDALRRTVAWFDRHLQGK